ncbi:DUF885 family protein [Fretibacter rubidus]|uniref:DUF885 family protein n=1 Tax=Fretibacter rubidus TaxID=570162 RepID=UPI00352A9234
MKRWRILAAIITVLGFAVANVYYWHSVVTPKETRLKFHQSYVAARNDMSKSIEDMEGAIGTLDTLNTKHLTRCEHITVHNIKAQYRRSIDKKSSKITATSHAMQRRAERYLGYTPTLAELRDIGEIEFAEVQAKLNRLQQRLVDQGSDKTLHDIAMRPAARTDDPSRVTEVYDALIRRAERDLRGQFYDYGLPSGVAKASDAPHRWSAPASYQRKDNTLIAYPNDGVFNLDVAAFISVHEIFPGHHLDLKNDKDSKLCDDFSTRSGFTYLLEGWVTYTEFVADEEGFFDAPEHKLAWLDYRLIRAMRILLDVERAEMGLTDKTHLQKVWQGRMPPRLWGYFEREYARLTASQHQHLGYLLGYQAIMDAKKNLQADLGERFDHRAFHDALLRLDHRELGALYDTLKIAMDMTGEDS